MLEDGKLLEKAAANITVVRGTLSPARAQAMSSRGRSTIDPAGGQPYSAAALSLVFHSAHPLVPTLRADVRLFQVGARMCSGTCCCQDKSHTDTDSFVITLEQSLIHTKHIVTDLRAPQQQVERQQPN